MHLLNGWHDVMSRAMASSKAKINLSHMVRTKYFGRMSTFLICENHAIKAWGLKILFLLAMIPLPVCSFGKVTIKRHGIWPTFVTPELRQESLIIHLLTLLGKMTLCRNKPKRMSGDMHHSSDTHYIYKTGWS